MRAAVWLGAGLAIALMPVPLMPASRARTCEPSATDAVTTASRLLADADDVGAERVLRRAVAIAPECAPLAIAFWATTGLQHARHAATRGGPPELLAPVVEAIDQLEVWRTRPGAVRDAEYAQTALRAASAAAQDERPELQIWITHAIELTARLDLAGEPPGWPLPAALLAGDLWYEVDRYAEAHDAYRQALDSAPSAYAQRGLARTLNRMGDVPGACRAYRALEARLEARSATSPALDEARAYLSGRACG